MIPATIRPCNRTTLNIIFTLLVVFVVLKFCEWQNVLQSTKKIVLQSNEEAVNGIYYTKSVYRPAEPIDLVYTWVNDTDERFLDQLSQFTINNHLRWNRYADNNELLYSLRSVERYAPWVRHIYIVTNGQIPSWLNLEHPRVTVVPHRDICHPDLVDTALPTFSSMAIEMMLHRIPNLSQRFIYLNDDIFLGKPLYLDDMRSEKDGIYVMPAWDFKYCAETCAWKSISNDVCEDGCNVTACNYDHGDCNPLSLEKVFANGTIVQNSEDAMPDRVLTKILVDEADMANHYMMSLLFTHTVLTRRYGFRHRKMIAHVGFLIDRSVMYDIERIIFPEEARNTENHRFRHGQDSLQYALVYHEVLLNEMRQKTDDEIFVEFDNNKDGVWNVIEIHNFIIKYQDTDVLKQKYVENFCIMMQECRGDHKPELSPTNRSENVDPDEFIARKLGCASNGTWDISHLSRREVFTCPQLLSQMRDRFATVRKYKATIYPQGFDKWTFHHIENDLTTAQQSFNELSRNRKLFNCINNDITPDDPTSFNSSQYKQIIELWQNFYFSQFPLQSEFELPHGKRNRVCHIDDLRAWQLNERYTESITLIGLVLSCCVVIAYIRQCTASK